MQVQQMKDEHGIYGKYQDEWVTINMLLSNQTLNYMYTEKCGPNLIHHMTD